MNRIFKVVFNKTKGVFVVGGEYIKTQGKSKKLKLAISAVLLGTSMLAGSAAMAEDITISAPVSGESNAGKYVSGTSEEITGDTITFESANPATNDSSSYPGNSYFAGVVKNGGALTIDAKDLKIGTKGGDRGIRLIGSDNTLQIFADTITANVGDEFVHVREGDGSSVANIGSAERRIGTFIGKTGWGKDDYGVSLLQVNEGNTLNFYAKNASFDGPTGAYGGVFGSGSHGTLLVDVSEKLTIDGNISGSYGTMNGENDKSTEFNMTVKAGELDLKGDINAGSMGEGYSNFSRKTNIKIEAAKAAVTGNIHGFGRGNIDFTADQLAMTGDIHGKKDSGIVVNAADLNLTGDIIAEETSKIAINQGKMDAITKIQGNIKTVASNTQDSPTVNIILSGEKSYLEGAIDDNAQGTSISFNNGASWNVTDNSVVNNLKVDNAQININGTNTQVKTNTLSGNANINLATVANGDDTYQAGNVTANNAENAKLNVNYTGITADNINNAQKAMQNLSSHIQATDANVTNHVAEGDVAGALTWTSINDAITNVKEQKNSTLSALTNLAANNFLVFRAQTNDLDKRMGDLRTMPNSDGAWARIIAGQSQYKNIHNTYQTLQAGIDHRIGNFIVGGRLLYRWRWHLKTW